VRSTIAERSRRRKMMSAMMHPTVTERSRVRATQTGRRRPIHGKHRKAERAWAGKVHHRMETSRTVKTTHRAVDGRALKVKVRRPREKTNTSPS
jgi:hypothetical protein